MIAVPRSLDEPSLLHGRLGCGAALVTALTAYGVAVSGTVLGRRVQGRLGCGRTWVVVLDSVWRPCRPKRSNAPTDRPQSQRNVRSVSTVATVPQAATTASSPR
jgi:hypothetical protein